MSSSPDKEMHMRLNAQEVYGIYFGSRGDDFKNLISSVINRSNLKKKYIDILLDDESMLMYASAFTSELVDPVNNYQVLEQIGDLTGNKFIVGYIYNKFPQLNCADGVKVVARLRINYGSKQCFSEIARKLGFWNFISATNDIRQRKMKPLLEDVFEAFLGATEQILDKRKRVGVGYAIVYDILASIFDEMNISLKYEDLYDAKTRLKELFDMYEHQLGPLVYSESKNDIITISTIHRIHGGSYQIKHDGTLNREKIIGGKSIKIGEGSASLKADAQQNASLAALKTLAKEGFVKPIPEIYQRFNNGSSSSSSCEEEYPIERICVEWGVDLDTPEKDINTLHFSKEKTKYQNKYQSTLLSMFCRLRNMSGVLSCIKLKADINILDSDGMSPIDLLFIGKKDENVVKNIMRHLINEKTPLIVHKGVFDMYVSLYIDEYFKSIIDKLKIVE